jgi:uncharacterized protein YndB with AHSA1/START domain
MVFDTAAERDTVGQKLRARRCAAGRGALCRICGQDGLLPGEEPIGPIAPPDNRIYNRRRTIAVFKKILIILVLIVIAFVGFVATQPADFRITRTATISAPPAVVFAQVNDFHNWQEWSPWAKLDPAAKNTFEGPAAGTGAGFTWSGNDKVGEGRMTITESHPSDLILIKLNFLRPFAATNTTEFTFKPEGDQTVVTWSMSGRNNFVGKAVCLVMNMPKIVGGQFEQGLAQIKAIAEAEAKK